MKQTKVRTSLFFGVAALSVIAALVPLLRGGRLNAAFLGSAVVFFALGVAIARQSGEPNG
jgi:hypothetical protein